MGLFPLYVCGAARSRACTRQALGEFFCDTGACLLSQLVRSALRPRRSVFGVWLGQNSSEQVRSPPHFSIRRLGVSGTCCRELRLGVELRQEPEAQHSHSRMDSKSASGSPFGGWPVVHGSSMQAMSLSPMRRDAQCEAENDELLKLRDAALRLGISFPAIKQWRQGIIRRVSARNQLVGRIDSVRISGLMAEVRISIGGQRSHAAGTRCSPRCCWSWFCRWDWCIPNN